MKQEPAFPVVGHLTDDLKMMGQLHHGMTLRDYFAAKAMTVVIADTFEEIAKVSYELADAMLKAREEGR